MLYLLPVYIFLNLYPPDVTLKGVPCQGLHFLYNPFDMHTIVSLVFDKEYIHWEPSGKLQNRSQKKQTTNDHTLYFIKLKWRKYIVLSKQR